MTVMVSSFLERKAVATFVLRTLVVRKESERIRTLMEPNGDSRHHFRRGDNRNGLRLESKGMKWEFRRNCLVNMRCCLDLSILSIR
ncbi:hypothetical protein Tco_0414516 [Tanacetum coccineum]